MICLAVETCSLDGCGCPLLEISPTAVKMSGRSDNYLNVPDTGNNGSNVGSLTEVCRLTFDDIG